MVDCRIFLFDLFVNDLTEIIIKTFNGTSVNKSSNTVGSEF